MSIRDYHPSDRSDCLAAFHTNVPHYFALAEIAQYENWLDKLENRRMTVSITLCSQQVNSSEQAALDMIRISNRLFLPGVSLPSLTTEKDLASNCLNTGSKK